MGDSLSLLSTQSHITIGGVLINIGATFITALGVLWVYRRISRTSSYDPAFPISLVLISAITCMVMMTIGQNLALSLGTLRSFAPIARSRRACLYASRHAYGSTSQGELKAPCTSRSNGVAVTGSGRIASTLCPSSVRAAMRP